MPHMYSQVWLTDAGRLIPRPHSISLTCASAASHQGVACMTTIGGSLSEQCSSSVTNLAIYWDSQSAAIYDCWSGMKGVSSTRNKSLEHAISVYYKCTVRFDSLLQVGALSRQRRERACNLHRRQMLSVSSQIYFQYSCNDATQLRNSRAIFFLSKRNAADWRKWRYGF